MTTFSVHDTVGDIVTRMPALSRVFEHARIDYCCGGGRPLGEVCRETGADAHAILSALQEAAAAESGPTLDLQAVGLSDLVDHIVGTHHVYLRTELPRLDALTDKVSSVHGDRDARLRSVRERFTALAAELSSHMIEEEQVLFPKVRESDTSGSLAAPIRRMEADHDAVGATLSALSELTDDYTAPDWACNTYRAMLDALEHLQHDLHQHVHKENNVLFPRVLAREGELTR